MAKNNSAVIDKTMIESFANDVNEELSNDVIYNLSDLIDDISIDLANHNSFISLNNVDLKLVGDFANKTNIPASTLEFFLTVRSGQLELNTLKEFQNKRKMLVRRLKNAWLNVKSRKKKRRFFSRKKKKKINEMVTEDQLKEKKEKPYTIVNLKDDYFEYIVSALSELSVIYNKPNMITILSKEELGYKINIIPAFIHDDELKVWNFNKNKFKSYFLNDSISLMEEKNARVNQLNSTQNTSSKILSFINNSNNIFYKVVKVFKTLTYNIWQTTDFSFIDSLLYNCPDEVFVGGVYDAFIRSFNFLKNANITDFRSIYNVNVSMYEQDEISIFEVKTLLKEMSNMITNNAV